MPINIGPIDLNNAITFALPAAGATTVFGTLDMQAIAPNSDAWRLGRLAVVIPAIGGNDVVADTITITLQAAPPLLTAGASSAAPNNPVPGAFVTPLCSQVITIPGVVAGGSVAQKAYFTMAFDANGSPYQFYQFSVAVNASITTIGELVTIGWEAS